MLLILSMRVIRGWISGLRARVLGVWGFPWTGVLDDKARVSCATARGVGACEHFDGEGRGSIAGC